MSVRVTSITIGAGSVEGHCGRCRNLKPIHFLDFVRQWSTGSYQGVHTMECEPCINELLREGADSKTTIRDERTINANA